MIFGTEAREKKIACGAIVYGTSARRVACRSAIQTGCSYRSDAVGWYKGLVDRLQGEDLEAPARKDLN